MDGIFSLTNALIVAGAIAYLAFQARQSKQLSDIRGLDSGISDYNNQLISLVNDPELICLLRSAMDNFEGLEKNEQARIHLLLSSLLLNSQHLFFQMNQSQCDRRTAQQIHAVSAAVLCTAGGQFWWQQTQAVWNAEFVAYIEMLCESVPPINTVWSWFTPDTAA